MDMNKLNYLVEKEIDRLNDLDIEDARLNKEIDRGNAVAQLSKSYIRSVSLALQVERFKADYFMKDEDLPEILRVGK